MKINWGTGIVIFMAAFMLFILSFVYKTFTVDSYDHHLVSEEYYNDELNYQQEIDAVANANKLEQNVVFSKTDKGLLIVFPKDMKNIAGAIEMQRPSGTKFDINLPIVLENNKMLISDDKLIVGVYRIKMKWKSENIDYMYKSKYTYE